MTQLPPLNSPDSFLKALLLAFYCREPTNSEIKEFRRSIEDEHKNRTSGIILRNTDANNITLKILSEESMQTMLLLSTVLLTYGADEGGKLLNSMAIIVKNKRISEMEREAKAMKVRRLKEIESAQNETVIESYVIQDDQTMRL